MKSLPALSGRVLLTLAMVACAAVLGQHVWAYYMLAPWTRDGHIRADVVRIAPDVSGLISEVLVADNQIVHEGDVLLRIDPRRFQIVLSQAEAQVESAGARLEFAATSWSGTASSATATSSAPSGSSRRSGVGVRGRGPAGGRGAPDVVGRRSTVRRHPVV